MRRRPFRLLAVLAAVLAAPQVAAAQATTTIDEGTFRIYIGGQEVGSETFTIRRSGIGDNAVLIAQGRILVDTAGAQELRTSLEVQGPVLRPTGYQVNIGAGERIAGRMLGGRFSAKIISPAGEQMREYLASEGAVLVDEGVAHHYFFLGRRGAEGSYQVPLIIPRQNRQVSARVTDIGMEEVTIGGTSAAARKLRIEPTGGPPRDVWLDGEGRVLRLEIASREYRAERTALPK